MIAIVLTGLVSLSLLLLLNRSHVGSELNLQRSPLLEHRVVDRYRDTKLLSRLGSQLRALLPKAFMQSLELEYLYLGRQIEVLEELLAQVLIVFLSLFLTYLLNHNVYFLLLALIVPALLLFELKWSLSSYHRVLESDAAHLFSCAKVLMINTETPMVSALRTIVATWPDPNSTTVYELNKIISKIEKSGPKEALSNWQVKSEKFRDFLSLLLSVSEGSSKRALRVALDKLVEGSRQEEKDRLQERADNLQLYLMGPVVTMLLVIMYPMAAAINFMMQNSLLKGDGI